MAKAKAKKLDFVRGRLVALASLVLALLFMQSVATSINQMLGESSSVVPNLYALTFALVSAAIGYWWDRRVRIIIAASLGLTIASGFIWIAVHGMV
jgi:hypothetical protein